jgi:hypothetical protein
MKIYFHLYICLLFCVSLSCAAETISPAAVTSQRQPGEYKPGPDSLPQEHAPKGKLEGPFSEMTKSFSILQSNV